MLIADWKRDFVLKLRFSCLFRTRLKKWSLFCVKGLNTTRSVFDVLPLEHSCVFEQQCTRWTFQLWMVLSWRQHRNSTSLLWNQDFTIMRCFVVLRRKRYHWNVAFPETRKLHVIFPERVLADLKFEFLNTNLIWSCWETFLWAFNLKQYYCLEQSKLGVRFSFLFILLLLICLTLEGFWLV